MQVQKSVIISYALRADPTIKQESFNNHAPPSVQVQKVPAFKSSIPSKQHPLHSPSRSRCREFATMLQEVQRLVHVHALLMLKLVMAEQCCNTAAAAPALLIADQLACAESVVKDLKGSVGMFTRCFRPGNLPRWWQEPKPPAGVDTAHGPS
eukprot:1142036-Pelagomonas_calceolata.AAC.2